MSHNIFTNENGVSSFASAIEPAWHKLGQILDHKMTATEAIQEAGLDYNVVKRSIFTEEAIEVPDFYATFREDTKTPLGVVKGRYQIVQNREVFSFFDAIVGEGKAIFETAGVLGKGERVFITAKLPGEIKVGNDVVDNYLFLTSTHDGTGAIRAAFTPTRVVCANTLAVAMGNGKNFVSVAHTVNAVEKLKNAHKLMDITAAQVEKVTAIFNSMAKFRVTDAQVLELIARIYTPTDGAEGKNELSGRTKNKIQEVAEYAFGHETQQAEETKGTLYGFVNGITGYYQNASKYENGDAKLKSILEGTARDYSTAAYTLANSVLTGSTLLS